MIWCVRVYVAVILVAVLAMCNFVIAQTPLTYQVTWAANTEADLGGYILESTTDMTGAGGWKIENSAIAKEATSMRVTSAALGLCFRLSAFDTSKQISAPSAMKCKQSVVPPDTIPPTTPNLLNVEIVATIPQDVPAIGSPSVSVTNGVLTVSWAAVDAETEVWLANNGQASKLEVTAKNMTGIVDITPTVNDWQCIQLRHKIGANVGPWAQADPQNPADINFCVVIP